MAGVDLKTVHEPMGHKTIAMTARYAHLAPTHKLSALETLARPGSVSAQSGCQRQKATRGQAD
jgi:site-specific recombinase XerC